MPEPVPGLRPWDALPADEQMRLRHAYGRHLDGLPPTCDLEAREQRFKAWLREQVWIGVPPELFL